MSAHNVAPAVASRPNDDAYAMARPRCASLNSHDLVEGVRAQVIDKDRNPKWSPPSLAAITTADVDAYFKPVDAELTFARLCAT